MGIFDHNGTLIGEIIMQQFKSSDPTEQNFKTEQKESVKTGKEYKFKVSLELDESNADFLQRAKLFIENNEDDLNTVALPVFPVVIISAINLPREFQPNYVDSYMPLSGKLDNVNYFYKATPQAWENLLLKNKYFSDNWNRYKL